MEATTLPFPKPLHFLKLLFFILGAAEATTFTFTNKCSETIWPGILSNSGSPQLETTGFELPSASSRSFLAPTGWSGRFWARTGCTAGSSTGWSCTTGDCGSGQEACNGAGAAPPATLAEFALSSSSSAHDFYDVSLVDGYNLPLLVEPAGGLGGCAAAGCLADLNQQCPAELRTGSACRSACEAFQKPEYCCSGAFASPATCRPSMYSQMFKALCPKSYSYAFDDPTSTFTCSGGADYTITFCPVSTPSQKSSRDSPTFSTSTPNITTSASATPTATGGVMLQDESWLASLATGESSASKLTVNMIHQSLLLGVVTACSLLLLVGL